MVTITLSLLAILSMITLIVFVLASAHEANAVIQPSQQQNTATAEQQKKFEYFSDRLGELEFGDEADQGAIDVALHLYDIDYSLAVEKDPAKIEGLMASKWVECRKLVDRMLIQLPPIEPLPPIEKDKVVSLAQHRHASK